MPEEEEVITECCRLLQYHPCILHICSIYHARMSHIFITLCWSVTCFQHAKTMSIITYFESHNTHIFATKCWYVMMTG